MINFSDYEYSLDDPTANTIVSKYPNFTEIVFYNKYFDVPINVIISDKIDRTRKWYYDENGVLQKKRPDSKLGDLFLTIKDSRKRTLDGLYNYVLSNPGWKYWVTLTFKHGETIKLDDSICMSQWKVFRQKLQRISKEVRILGTRERHHTEVGGLHLHMLIGNIDLDDKLLYAYNRDPKSKHYGEYYKTKFGDQVYNFVSSFYPYGYNTVVKLRDDSNNLQIANYMSKYMTKDMCELDYGTRAIYRTHNLKSKEKQICYFTKELLMRELAQYDLTTKIEQIKSTNGMTVYRIYESNILL